MSTANKIAILCMIIATTLFYAHYEKSKLDRIQSTGPILTTLPEFEVLNVSNDSKLTSKNLLDKPYSLYMVHFWGTWCAPCEWELPEFVKLANELEKLNIAVLLIAVNDELPKVKKYLKRFKKNLAPNVYWSISMKPDILDLFGTVKVPETYVFDQKGQSLRKFVGPQDWSNPSFFQRIQLLTLD